MKSEHKFRGITRFLFVTTQACALVWVTMSYLIALYATVELGQPFPVETLSGQAIDTILGVTTLKVIENVFEHNEGLLFGTSKIAEYKEDIHEHSEETDQP